MWNRFWRKVKDVRSYRAQHGTLQLLRYYAERMGFAFRFRRVVFLEVDLSRLSCPKAPSNVEVIRATAKAFEGAQYKGSFISHDKAMRWLQSSNKALFIARLDGETAAYAWAELQSVDLDFFDLDLPLSPETGYISHLSCFPISRRKGVGGIVYGRVCEYLRNQGCCKAFVAVHPDNVAALRLSLKLGFREYQTATYFRCLGLRRYEVRDLAQERTRVMWNRSAAERQIRQAFSLLPEH